MSNSVPGHACRKSLSREFAKCKLARLQQAGIAQEVDLKEEYQWPTRSGNAVNRDASV